MVHSNVIWFIKLRYIVMSYGLNVYTARIENGVISV